ncbi:MAG: hypothetical protein ACHQNE_04585, partial [Candidatus Kapaibacterium sp.]
VRAGPQLGWSAERGARSQDARARKIDSGRLQAGPIFSPIACENLLRGYLSCREDAGGLRRALPEGLWVVMDVLPARMIFEWAALPAMLVSGLCVVGLA